MSSTRKSYTLEEEKLLLDLKAKYDDRPWSWIRDAYNKSIQDPRRHRSEDGLINKHKALRKKIEAENKARMRRIANNGRPEAYIPIFTEVLPPGQSAMSHQYSPYFQNACPTGVDEQESETYTSPNFWPQTSATWPQDANKTIEEDVDGRFDAYPQYFIESGN